MFSFFSSRQRQHERTMATLNQITMDAAARMQQDADRANRRAENAREEMHEESHQSYMRAAAEITVLREELAKRDQELLEQKDLVAYWANGNEAFRRTIQHLCQFWAPIDQPNLDHAVKDGQIKQVMDDKISEIIADPEWVGKRTEKNKERIKKRRQHAS